MRNGFGSRIGLLVRSVATAIMATSLVAATPVSAAPSISEGNPKYAAIVVDTATGKVLYERNADARRYPASLTKMMTLYVLFEDLDRGRFKLSTPFKVSRNAALQAPSKLGLKPGATISVEDSIKALVTKSANDAAAVIAENVSGSIPAFADRMTRTARAIGMNGTRFRNANGLPDPGQYTTARDMMKLGVALQVRFPTYYGYFQTRSFNYKGRVHGNHNRLLGRIEGVDGIKTGYINASGFNLVSSVKRDGRKIVAVVMGGRTAGARDSHMIALIDTYLPRASRGGGFDRSLVAAIRSAPKVAASAPYPEPVVAAVAAAPTNHPRPPARPAIVIASASAMSDPAAHVPMPPRPVEQVVASAALPSSAAEAFADVAPLEQGSSDQLAAMIEQSLDGDDQIEVASIEPRLVEPVLTIVDVVPQPIPAPDVAEATVAPQPRKPVIAMAAASGAPRKVSGAGGWLIQIGAVESEKAANALLSKAQAKVGGVLADAEPVTESFEKGSTTYIRARFSGFASQTEAQKACATLKKNAFACFPVRL